ncbi:MAG: DUF2088 domain-containing protein [Candidatus Lokiarchaeota archaeon]|nr:DUF2088 domain-containing protein [Candidatus Lokiarchaeota archaeon]MBD3343409.1 DUF2088 domain-containing protein [Candidatus Lokiarchaeota archaeon]
MFPKIRCVRQEIKLSSINQIEPIIKKKLEKFNLKAFINPKDTVAITGSSRGIKDQDIILKVLVKYIKKSGGLPFVFPAMGSHGGATAQGQIRILQEYGITEERIGCPIKASMEVTEIAKNEFGSPIYVDKFAASADKIILINRIKNHSKFIGEVESGLSKMCVVGLGKHKGAKNYHRLIDRHSWRKVVDSLMKIIIKKLPILCGIGLIQNNHNEISEIHILSPAEFSTKEPKLLKRYKNLTEKLPFNDIDLLIVDEMGKNIFGTGMDTMVTGRKPGSKTRVQWLFVRDLSKETHGNAQGIGLADFTTKRLVDKIDFTQTYLNALTAYRTDSPKIPIFFKNDMKVLENVFDLFGKDNLSTFKLVWIKNTLELEKLIVSEALFKEVEKTEILNFMKNEEQLEFDADGFLTNSEEIWGENRKI